MRPEPPACVAPHGRSDQHREFAHASDTIGANFGNRLQCCRIPASSRLPALPELSDEGRDDYSGGNSKRLRNLRHDVRCSPRSSLPRNAARSPPEPDGEIRSNEDQSEKSQVHDHGDRTILGQNVLQRFAHGCKDSLMESGTVDRDKIERIHSHRPVARTPVKMRSCHSPSRADETDLLTTLNGISRSDERLAQMEVRGDDTTAVIDVDDITRQKEIPHESDNTAIGRVNR